MSHKLQKQPVHSKNHDMLKRTCPVHQCLKLCCRLIKLGVIIARVFFTARLFRKVFNSVNATHTDDPFPTVPVVFAAILKSGQIKNEHGNLTQLFDQAPSYWVNTQKEWDKIFKEMSLGDAISKTELPANDDAEVIVLWSTHIPECDIPRHRLGVQKVIKEKNLSADAFYEFPRGLNPTRYGFQIGWGEGGEVI